MKKPRYRDRRRREMRFQRKVLTLVGKLQNVAQRVVSQHFEDVRTALYTTDQIDELTGSLIPRSDPEPVPATDKNLEEIVRQLPWEQGQ